jgi:hypothetical protein
MRDNPMVIDGRSNATIAAPFLVMRGPEDGPLFRLLTMASPYWMIYASY